MLPAKPDREEAAEAFDIVMSGEATPAQIGALLMAMRVRGETVDEIAGAARAMRAKVLAVRAPEGAIDTCGTGGDGKGTLQYLDRAAFVVAGAGVPVAKHGNRAISSRSGGADVLTALGVNVELTAGDGSRDASRARASASCSRRRITPRCATSAGSRVELGTRTIFNLLGRWPIRPARNGRSSACSRRSGSSRWREVLACSARTGLGGAWPGAGRAHHRRRSAVAAVEDGRPRPSGFRRKCRTARCARPKTLSGGDAVRECRAIPGRARRPQGPYRDMVLLNAAAALIVAGKAGTLREGVALAARSIDSGAALAVLEALVPLSHGKV